MPPDMRSLMSLVAEDAVAVATPTPLQAPQAQPAPRSKQSYEFREKLTEILKEYSSAHATPKPVAREVAMPPAPTPVRRVESAPAVAVPPRAEPLPRPMQTPVKPAARIEPPLPPAVTPQIAEAARPAHRPLSRVESTAPITKAVLRFDPTAPVVKPVPAVMPSPLKQVAPELFIAPPVVREPEFSPAMATQLAGITIGAKDDHVAVVNVPEEPAPAAATRGTDREGTFFTEPVPVLDMGLYQEWPVESALMIAELLGGLDQPAASEPAPAEEIAA